MKFLFLFLTVCVFGVSCNVLTMQTSINFGDKVTLRRQKDILRLFDRVIMQNTHQDQIDIGRNFDILKHINSFVTTDDVKKCFMDYGTGVIKTDKFFITTTTNAMGTLTGLPKNQPFVITNDNHRREAVCLFKLFYHAKDYDTFYRTACWARERINQNLYTYALTVAIKHRQDCMNFVIPAPYEITPYKFVNTDVIHKVEGLKMQGKILNHKLANVDGIFQKDNVITVYDNNVQVQLNKEQKLCYFTDDIGLNTLYYFYHINNPFWMHKKYMTMDVTRRGEHFYFYHKQLLARYYLERLANGLGEIPNFYWNLPIETGFVSTLRLNNGMTLANRPNKHLLKTKNNFYHFMLVTDCERTIRDTVRRGFFFTKDGGFVKVRDAEDINKLGNFIQGNLDSENFMIVENCIQNAKHLLGNGRRVNKNNDRKVLPGAMDFYETALRDPMFYQLNKRFMINFFFFKNKLPTYTRDELFMNGVVVNDVVVDKLVTFFDNYDIDVTNNVYRTEIEKVTNKDNLVFVARQTRLNHKRFMVKINVNSNKATDVVVRMFLGPKYDGMGNKLNINENRHNFLEIDSFLYKLKVGDQIIQRNSRDFLITHDDTVPTRTFMNNIKDAMTTDDITNNFLVNTCKRHTILPNRLLLPKGKKGGMKLKLFVIINERVITKGVHDKIDNIECVLDNRALGYPFDRRINRNNFFTTNMFMRDVVIYHVGFLNNKVDNTGFFIGDDNDNSFLINDKFMTDTTDFLGHTGFLNDNTRFMTGTTGVVGDNTGFYDNTRLYGDNVGTYTDTTNFVNPNFVNTNTGTGFYDDNYRVNDRVNVDNVGLVQTKNI